MNTSHMNPCRICKTPVVVQAPGDCPPEWIAKLLPAVTCNNCYDLMVRRDAVTDKIRRCATLLIRTEAFDSKNLPEVRTRMRVYLLDATREYAEVCRRYRKINVLTWNQDFADLILDKPEKWWEHLRNYRAGIPQNEVKTMREAAK